MNGSSLLSKIPKINKSTIVIILFMLTLVGISLYYYFTFGTTNNSFKPNLEHKQMDSTNSQAELILFSVDWCPHCKKAQPIWDELKAEYEDKTINGYTILFTEVNCTNESPEVEKMINKYKIEGYPTIKLLKDGNVIEYDAKPNKATLQQFLNTVL
jgi:thiol-disulfide isomerase/thioredoxin